MNFNLVSSGNSKNIIEVLKYAKKKSINSVLFSGMNGGIAKTIATHHINFNSKNFGLVEDCFQSIMHIIAQNLYKKTNIFFYGLLHFRHQIVF